MTKPKSLIAQLRAQLSSDSIGKKADGTIVVRRGYFYRNGMTSEKFAQIVQGVLARSNIDLTVKEHGDHWAAFRGGASVANSSHFWVELVAG
jgi:hypothetical protein